MKTGRPVVVLLGAGGLARAMARSLARSSAVTVTLWSRRPEAAAAAARGLVGARAVRRIEDALLSADIVLLAVPDRAIAPLAAAIVSARASWRGIVVLHAAGAYGPELLAPLRARGAATGVLHPMAVLGAGSDAALSGASARIEGSAKAIAQARRLCALLGLVPLRGEGLGTARGRLSYHAAASLVSNDLIALLAAAHALLVRQGVSGRSALLALSVLAEGAIGQARRAGVLGALTGPVARNDHETLAAQLRALARTDRTAAEAHRALSLRLVDLAEEGGRLDRKAARALRGVLARGREGSPTV